MKLLVQAKLALTYRSANDPLVTTREKHVLLNMLVSGCGYVAGISLASKVQSPALCVEDTSLSANTCKRLAK